MQYTRIYDALIQKYWTIPMPWEWAKAQLIAESDLDPKAVSPVGAQGIAQFMPDTWKWCCEELDMVGADVFNPLHAIPAYGWYMQTQCWDKWTVKRPDLDRLQLSFSTYNAGIKSIVRAQQWAQMAPGYLEIIAKLDAVTGIQNAEQTRNYVTRCGAIYLQLTEVA